VRDESEPFLDAETLAGILKLLMRIDARLEELAQYFLEDDDEEDDA
jgi:hypothetical protein